MTKGRTDMISETRKASLAKEWSKIAGEKIDLQLIGGGIYAFGSELACYRIYMKYRNSPDKVRAEYSTNKKSWFFVLDIDF